jgi:hypothetical protein
VEILFQGVIIVLVGLVLRGLWRAGRPQPYFTVRVVNGEPKAVQGTVTPALLRLVAEVVAFNQVKSGRIWGVESSGWIRLKFSKSIPEPARQQLRNGWGAMGWKGPSKKARR